MCAEQLAKALLTEGVATLYALWVAELPATVDHAAIGRSAVRLQQLYELLPSANTNVVPALMDVARSNEYLAANTTSLDSLSLWAIGRRVRALGTLEYSRKYAAKTVDTFFNESAARTGTFIVNADLGGFRMCAALDTLVSALEVRPQYCDKANLLESWAKSRMRHAGTGIKCYALHAINKGAHVAFAKLPAVLSEVLSFRYRILGSASLLGLATGYQPSKTYAHLAVVCTYDVLAKWITGELPGAHCNDVSPTVMAPSIIKLLETDAAGVYAQAANCRYDSYNNHLYLPNATTFLTTNGVSKQAVTGYALMNCYYHAAAQAENGYVLYDGSYYCMPLANHITPAMAEAFAPLDTTWQAVTAAQACDRQVSTTPTTVLQMEKCLTDICYDCVAPGRIARDIEGPYLNKPLTDFHKVFRTQHDARKAHHVAETLITMDAALTKFKIRAGYKAFHFVVVCGRFNNELFARAMGGVPITYAMLSGNQIICQRSYPGCNPPMELRAYEVQNANRGEVNAEAAGLVASLLRSDEFLVLQTHFDTQGEGEAGGSDVAQALAIEGHVNTALGNKFHMYVISHEVRLPNVCGNSKCPSRTVSHTGSSDNASLFGQSQPQTDDVDERTNCCGKCAEVKRAAAACAEWVCVDLNMRTIIKPSCANLHNGVISLHANAFDVLHPNFMCRLETTIRIANTLRNDLEFYLKVMPGDVDAHFVNNGFAIKQWMRQQFAERAGMRGFIASQSTSDTIYE